MIRDHNEIYPEINPISIDFKIINNHIDFNNINKKIIESVKCQ